MLSFFRNIYHATMEDDCPGLAAEMAFHLLLSLVPTVVVFVSLFGLFNQKAEFISQFDEALKGVLPWQSLELLKSLATNVAEYTSSQVALVSLAIAFWAASNGFGVVVKGLNRAYNIAPQTGEIVLQRLAGMALLFLVWAFLLMGSSSMVLVTIVIDNLSFFIQTFELSPYLELAARWLFPALSMGLFSTLLYGLIPTLENKPFRWQTTLPGTLTFVTMWLGFSWGFGEYLTHFNTFGAVYGVLGAVVVLMIWLYVTCLSLLIGGEVNTLLIQKKMT